MKGTRVHVDRALPLEDLSGARRLVVEDDVRTKRLHILDLLVGPRARNDLAPRSLGDLDGDTKT